MTAPMGSQTAEFVLGLLAERDNDRERTARYMRDVLRIGGIKACRDLVRQALVYGYGEACVFALESERIA